MARLNLHIATNAKGPAKQRVIGMYVVEIIDGAKLETKEGMLVRESATGQELTLMLMINALYVAQKLLKIAPVQQYESIEIYTNEQIVQSALLNKWIDKWQESNWKTAKGTEVKYCDLWKQLEELLNACAERMIFSGRYEFDPSEHVMRDSSYLSWIEMKCSKKLRELEDQEKVEGLINKFKEKMDNV